ncbi:hypothetical protein AB0L06_39085 [Spirillospora sp. NPDC052269]
MKVVCIRGRAIVTVISAAYNPMAVADVTIGSSYPVAAISIYSGMVMVLIRDDAQLPCWYPMEMFDVVDPHLPSDWLFANYSDSEFLQAIWGYEELVMDESHYDALLEREDGALVIFNARVSSFL